MNSWGRYLLQPVFNMLAKPGLGNPHTPHEAELLIAGVKPTAIMNRSDISCTLQQAISNGHIVHIESVEWVRDYIIYCRKELAEQAAQAAILLHDNHGKTNWPPEDFAFLETLFRDSTDTQDTVHERIYAMEHALDHHDEQALQPIHHFLQGELNILPPVRQGLNAQMDDALSAHGATYAASRYSLRHEICVLAQHDKIAEGRELFSLYYGNDAPAPMQNPHQRIAQLLGYTENDYAWHAGTKYQSPLTMRVMTATAPLRAWARRESLLSQRIR